ncbi:MAG TPA: hypothetical protein VGG32_02505 [Thermoplasmata archaeon]|jgi:hypothetical protein
MTARNQRNARDTAFAMLGFVMVVVLGLLVMGLFVLAWVNL